ncbi:MAG: hypothetical protein HDS26_03025 [Bacteroides sp.]|nr:hypothetical protein [Bacteroides sp.]
MKKTINTVRIFDGQKLTAPTNVVIENGYISYTCGGRYRPGNAQRRDKNICRHRFE